MAEISVVIPHFDDLENLATCLDLLDQQTLERRLFEVIIADNNSRCGLAAVEQIARGRARVVLATEKGAGPARNHGVSAARGNILAFIDSDCRPRADWLRSGCAALEHHPIVGGPVIIEPKDPLRPNGIEAFDMVFGFDAREFLSKHGFIGSGNLFVQREVFTAVGGFRSGVSEDVEWSRRAVSLGYYLMHDAGAVVGHPARDGWGEFARKWKRHTRESYLLAREKRLGRLQWLLQAWLVLVSPVPHSIVVLRSERLISWRDRFAAIKALFQIRFFRFLESHRVLLRSPG
jgi:glycosyltransferase involved in cell wall biosynthesis